MARLFSQDSAWISGRAEYELNAAVDWMANSVQTRSDSISEATLRRRDGYAVHFSYSRHNKGWIKASITYPEDHGESVQIMEFLHSNHYQLSDSKTKVRASVSIDAIKSLRQTTGRKLQRGNVLSLQSFEIAAFLNGFEKPPTFQVFIKKFKPIVTSVHQFDHDPQKLEDYSFIAGLRKRLVENFKVLLPRDQSNSPLQSPKTPQNPSGQSVSKPQYPVNPIPLTTVNGNSKSIVDQPENTRSVLKEIENLNRTTRGTDEEAIQSSQMNTSNTQRPSNPSEVQTQSTIPKSTSKKSIQPSYDNWETMPRIKRSITKVPEDQRRILDTQEAWLPPNPGKQFKPPSMPVSVLNELIESRESNRTSKSQNEPSSTPKSSQRHQQQQQSGPGPGSGSQYHSSNDKDDMLTAGAAAVGDKESDKESDEGSDKNSDKNSDNDSDNDSDGDVLSETWEPTPVEKLSRNNDDLPADTPSKSPSKSQRRNTPYRSITESGSYRVLPGTPKQSEDLVSPSQLKSSPVQRNPKSFTPVESPLINAASSSNVRANSVEELPTSTAELAPKRNKVRRSRRSMPWASREGSSTDSAKKRTSTSKTLASVTQDLLRSSTGPPPKPKPAARTLAQVTQGHLSSPAVPTITNKRLSDIQPDPLLTDLAEPQSSLPMPLEAPQNLQNLPNDQRFTPTPNTSKSIIETPQRQELIYEHPDSLFVPSTNLTFQNFENQSPLAKESRKRKDDSTQLQPITVKRPKALDIRYILTEDDPVSQDPSQNMPQEMPQQKQSFVTETTRKSLPPISLTVIRSAERSLTAIPPELQSVSGPNPPAIVSPALNSMGRSIFDRTTPRSPPLRPESPLSIDKVSHPTFEDIFKEFTHYYEAQGHKYKGNQRRFYGMCKILGSPSNKWPEFMNDDLIMRHADDYKVYVDECMDNARYNMDFMDWAKKGIKGQRCHGGIMTEEKLMWAINGNVFGKNDTDEKGAVS